MRLKQGQNLLEYVLVASVVIVVIVLFSGNFFAKMVSRDKSGKAQGAFSKHFDNMRARIGTGSDQ